MIAATLAELRKLWTTRATYWITFGVIALTLFINGWVLGVQMQGNSQLDPSYITEQLKGTISFLAIIAALVGLMLTTYEYRYNTILYSLTALNRRYKLLVAKVIVVSLYTVAVTLLLLGLAVLALKTGVALGGHHLVAQHVAWGDVLWRSLFFAWGEAMFALIIAFLVRNQAGTTALFFIIPSTLEQLAILLLHDNARYLPFTVLRGVIVNSGFQTVHNAVAWVLGYIVVFGGLAAVLFIRRDAN